MAREGRVWRRRHIHDPDEQRRPNESGLQYADRLLWQTLGEAASLFVRDEAEQRAIGQESAIGRPLSPGAVDVLLAWVRGALPLPPFEDEL
jgi:hypothetical protein